MGYAGLLLGDLGDLGDFAHHNLVWMSWNLTLAAVPAALAVLLFAGRDRTGGAVWWAGAAAFVLMLPNAPYVVTDLVHLRRDTTDASMDGSVVLGILPVYALFIAVGFACYGIALAELTRFAGRVRCPWSTQRIELAVHLVASVGIVLGRVARLNSWDALISPIDTAGTVGTTLTWDKAPVAVAVTFVAVWAVHTVLRILYRAAAPWLTPRAHPLAP